MKFRCGNSFRFALAGGAACWGPAQPLSRAPYTVHAAPNLKSKVLVAAIVPTDLNLPGQRAAPMAAFFRRKFKAPPGLGFQVYVFNDVKAAQASARHQKARRSAPLAARDFQKLLSLWPRAVAFYEFAHGRESVRYPQRNPGMWWQIVKPEVTRRSSARVQ